MEQAFATLTANGYGLAFWLAAGALAAMTLIGIHRETCYRRSLKQIVHVREN